MKIEIYTTPTCSYCRRAKEFFREKSLKYTEIDVSEDEKAQKEMFVLSGQAGTPVILVTTKDSKEVFIGFNSAVGARILELSGK